MLISVMTANPVKTVLQEICKSCKYFSCKTALNLVLKVKLFLQDVKNLARILQEKLQGKFLARFSLLVQDLVQDLASLARKIIARLEYFL